jgi:hypothetical protein
MGGGSLVSLLVAPGLCTSDEGKYSELDDVGRSGTGELRDR